ncbi:MAG: phosphatidate cytidylyltransferase [Candidatus Hydrogenedens sp.]
MFQRIITGSILVILTAILIWVPGLHIPLGIFIACLTTIAVREYFHIVEPANKNILSILTLGLVPLTVLTGILHTLIMLHLFFILSFGLLSIIYTFNRTTSINKFAHSFFGLFYFGWVPAHLLILHKTPGGPGLITLFITAVALCDSGAYCIGKLFGKHALAPEISPNKTWEGSMGGIIFSTVGTFVLWILHKAIFTQFLPVRSIGFYLQWGIILAILSQFGDLLESRWKREVGIKDSGTIFPGHGGVLDRCDGMLFAFPFFFYLIKFL